MRLPRLPTSEGIPECNKTAQAMTGAEAALKVLIVDDNADGAEMLSDYLKMTGYCLKSVNGSLDALKCIKEERFDVCILDIGLPDMTGYELAERILRMSTGAPPPTLIALTGYGQDKDRTAAFNAGFSHHFVKPVNVIELSATLTAISRSRSTDHP